MVSVIDSPVNPTADNSDPATAALLIVEENPELRTFLSEALYGESAVLEMATKLHDAELMCRRCHFDLIIINTRVAEHSGIEWMQSMHDKGVESDVIFLAQDQGMLSAIAALRLGAVDYLCPPFEQLQIQASVRRCLDQRLMKSSLIGAQQSIIECTGCSEEIVGECDAISAVRMAIAQFAPMPSTILIEGETGTGKELVAQALHRFSGRCGQFVALNCGAIAAELLESELFGHTRGAFTGAQKPREGLLLYADGGTLFLDEISEMPLPMQVKLLRAIEQKMIRPVGSEREIAIDIRLVAATNLNLKDEIARGNFRSDLYYRINVATIMLPALRERHGDIALLAHYFIAQLAAELNLPPIKLNAVQIQQLSAHHWPGNVRELRNVIERSLLSGGLCFEFESPAIIDDNGESPIECTLAQVEKAHAMRVLESVDGNKSEAARRLGISRKTLERKVKDWRMNDEEHS